MPAASAEPHQPAPPSRRAVSTPAPSRSAGRGLRRLLALLLPLLLGCAPPAEDPAASWDQAAAQQALDRWVAAAVAGDRAGFDAELSTADPGFAATADELFANLEQLGRVEVELATERAELRPGRAEVLGQPAVVVRARATWSTAGRPRPDERLQGTVWLTWLVEDGRPRLAGTVDGPARPDAAVPHWWLEPVTVQRVGETSLLTGAGVDADAWRRRTEQAVAAVAAADLDAARPEGPPPAVVVQVPSTSVVAGRVLGGDLAGRAAVTVADPAGALPVVVDPAANLTGPAWRFLLTHELVHVRTASPASRSPRWLVEGLAESVAREAQPDLAPVTAEQADDAARLSGLPDEEQLAAEPGAAYLRCWVAVRLLQDRLGPVGLLDLVAQTARGAPVEQRLRAAGWSEEELAAAVQGALADLAAGRDVASLRSGDGGAG
ncbi:hypothetical protein GC722_15135 [Auraticoccus sp. F435]|uniref:Peptidase MA-like domain-containing protein n=1 Tax=Auraticoccus cholistanensis TaxID=2656650 RepID=A0A6A9UZD2_9ACTN|nr:hypothetical protein [Auraticoccus cholistanensis]MVA77344.1 hypothetical protein [Auraticoccus cholistanensis]